MKRVISLFLAMAIVMMLAGCNFVSSALTGLQIGAKRVLTGEELQYDYSSSQPESSDIMEDEIIDEAADSSGSSATIQQISGETQRVGSKEFGYVDLPLTWEPYPQEGKEHSFYYYDRKEISMLLISTYDSKQLELKEMADTAKIATQLAGMENITMVESSLNGQKAYNISAEKEDQRVRTWIIKRGTNGLHINLITKPENIEKVAAYVENTYSFSE